MKIVDFNTLRAMGNKKKNAAKLEFFKMEREMIRKAQEGIAVTTDVEVISAEEIADIVKAISPSGFVYRVTLDGANEIYNAINEHNYKQLANGIGHLEEDDEFLVGMCLIDKCEEYADYEAMAEVFKVYEYVVRHKKANSPVITYARQYNIGMRMHLTNLNLL